MPNLPDIPGKDLVDGTTRRARAIAGAAGAGALAAGGFVAKRVLDARRRGGEGTEPSPTLAERPQPVAEPVPAKPTAPKAAAPKVAKPKSATPKAAKPKSATPKAAKPKPAGTPPATTGTDAPTVPGAEAGDRAKPPRRDNLDD